LFKLLTLEKILELKKMAQEPLAIEEIQPKEIKLLHLKIVNQK